MCRNSKKFSDDELNTVTIENVSVNDGAVKNPELLNFLKSAIDHICITVRNKMVAPYTILQTIDNTQAPQELVNLSLNDINWLCHNYLPNLSTELVDKAREFCDR